MIWRFWRSHRGKTGVKIFLTNLLSRVADTYPCFYSSGASAKVKISFSHNSLYTGRFSYELYFYAKAIGFGFGRGLSLISTVAPPVLCQLHLYPSHCVCLVVCFLHLALFFSRRLMLRLNKVFPPPSLFLFYYPYASTQTYRCSWEHQ